MSRNFFLIIILLKTFMGKKSQNMSDQNISLKKKSKNIWWKNVIEKTYLVEIGQGHFLTALCE